jgi:hypothetical protein
MMEHASSNSYQTRHESQGVTEFSFKGQHEARRLKKVKWRFKPRPFGTLLAWGLMLFIAGRIVVVPFVEGVCQYCFKTQELAKLQQRSQILNKQLATLKKTRNYMQTDAYVEEKGHQIGMIKQNESQMVVVNPNALKLKEDRNRRIKQEIYKD